MTSSLVGAVAFTVANVVFVLLLLGCKRVGTSRAQSLARESLLWVTLVVQVIAAVRGIAVLPNDGTWFGLLDDAGCALGGLWLGALAIRERRTRGVLFQRTAAAHSRGKPC